MLSLKSVQDAEFLRQLLELVKVAELEPRPDVTPPVRKLPERPAPGSGKPPATRLR
jgi:hypothetical protein